jgi:hypothetical protein
MRKINNGSEQEKNERAYQSILMLQYKRQIYFKIKINLRIIKVRVICEVHNIEENELKF